MSALLYILVAEVLGMEIRLNKNIKGYKYGNNEHKILQYADDTNICVTDFPSMYEGFDVLKIYEAASGAK